MKPIFLNIIIFFILWQGIIFKIVEHCQRNLWLIPIVVVCGGFIHFVCLVTLQDFLEGKKNERF